MKEKYSASDIILRLSERSGITKKLAAEVVRALPEIIGEGLLSEGEARVRGLGTFRLKKVAAKKGRNPQTGEEVVVPSHEKLVFLPEESFREQVNEQYRFLGIKILEEEMPVPGSQPAVSSPQAARGSHKSAFPVEEGTESDLQAAAVNMADTGVSPETGTRKQDSETVEKRRNYWLIPVTIGVVILLSIVFYWRNFYPGKQEKVIPKLEDARQVEAVSQVAQDRDSLKPQLKSQEPETLSGQQPAVSDRTVDSGRTAGIEPQASSLPTDLTTVTIGTHLFQLAREVYGNPFLWVLIYRANQDRISDPDQVVSGRDILIPSLEGKPGRLSKNDSIALSDGYRLVYEFYQGRGDTRAEAFRQAMEKYHPR